MNRSGVRIRRLSPDEWAAYREIRLAALAESPDAFGSSLERSRQYTEEIWRDRLTTAVTFAAEREADRRLLGIASGLPTAIAGTAALIGMWVAPEARRQGIGEALVQRVIAWALEAGVSRLELEVTVGNDRAERLYARCEFARAEQATWHSPEDGHRTITMARAVGKPFNPR